MGNPHGMMKIITLSVVVRLFPDPGQFLDPLPVHHA
jgi:hypothetical protein